MKARSTQALVGLCGKGHDNDARLHAPRSPRRASSPSKKSSPGSFVLAPGIEHRHGDDRGAREARAGQVDRVARARHDRAVARSEQHPHQVGEALLGPDRRHDLGVGIEVDVEEHLVAVGDRETQIRDAATRAVAVILRVVRGLGQLLDGHVGTGQIGIAEAEVDDVASVCARVGLQPVDLCEDVGRQAGDASKLHLGNVTQARLDATSQSRRHRRRRRDDRPGRARRLRVHSSVAGNVSLERSRPTSPRPSRTSSHTVRRAHAPEVEGRAALARDGVRSDFAPGAKPHRHDRRQRDRGHLGEQRRWRSSALGSPTP